jgi:hypothetical protein
MMSFKRISTAEVIEKVDRISERFLNSKIFLRAYYLANDFMTLCVLTRTLCLEIDRLQENENTLDLNAMRMARLATIDECNRAMLDLIDDISCEHSENTAEYRSAISAIERCSDLILALAKEEK